MPVGSAGHGRSSAAAYLRALGSEGSRWGDGPSRIRAPSPAWASAATFPLLPVIHFFFKSGSKDVMHTLYDASNGEPEPTERSPTPLPILPSTPRHWPLRLQVQGLPPAAPLTRP